MNHEVAERVRKLVAATCALPPDAIKPQGRLIGYGLDSARALDLIVSIEDAFGIELNTDDLYEVHTFADLVDHVARSLPVE